MAINAALLDEEITGSVIDAQVKRNQLILAEQNKARATHSQILEGSYQFPADLAQGDGDLLNWMKFQAFEISGGFKETKMVQFSQNDLGFAALPIPAGIQASYDQSWNQTEVGQFKQTAARATEAAFGGRGITNFLTGVSQPGPGSTIGERFDQQFGSFQVAQEATAAALQSTGAAETMQFTLGLRALDQVMMSYGGPAFRSFNFSFALKPLNEKDSEMIDQIVTFFNMAAAPFKLQTQMTRIYDLPNVFKITFHNGWSENPWLPRIGHCALTNVGVSYGGDKFTTYNNSMGMPVQTDLTLQFKEMELLDRNSFVAGSIADTGAMGDEGTYGDSGW